MPWVASACPDVLGSRSTRFLKHPLLRETHLSPGVPTAFPQRAMRASPACTKQMVKHGLTRSEINLRFASQSHNHVIIPGIGEEQAPGSCFLLGHFAWQDGARGFDPALLLLQGPIILVGLPSILLVYGLQFSVQQEVLGEDRACGRSSSSPSHPTSPSSLALGLSTLCRRSPAGNTSQSTFPNPWHGTGANPAC